VDVWSAKISECTTHAAAFAYFVMQIIPKHQFKTISNSISPMVSHSLPEGSILKARIFQKYFCIGIAIT
jgi:hypothetical protein